MERNTIEIMAHMIIEIMAHTAIKIDETGVNNKVLESAYEEMNNVLLH